MKRIILVFAVWVVAGIAQAHEFWLEPDKFFYNVGESVRIRFLIGDGFVGEAWDLKRHKVEKLEHHSAGRIANLVSGVKVDGKANLELKLEQEGTHLLSMESNQAFIELDAEKFNGYLKEDGLEAAYAHREKTNTLNTPGKELYSRHAKLLVQVGNKTDDSYKKQIGMPIEIIPEKNPYALKKGDIMRFRILFQGKPLFPARVKVMSRASGRTMIQNIYTEKDGTMETRVSDTASWMVSVVHMIPSKTQQADWESYWGSLVFGVK